jgi:hypothetical protein
MEPSLFSDEDEWEAEMEDELADPFEVEPSEPMTPEAILKMNIDDFVAVVTEKALKGMHDTYQKQMDRLQNEISIHLAEKDSLSDTIVAMEQHIKYLEKRLLGKE